MKNKEEQIQEMAKTMCEEFGTDVCKLDCPCMSTCANKDISERLYSAGYRKASDVIDEFVEKIICKLNYDRDSELYNKTNIFFMVNKIAAEMRQEIEK